MTGNPFREHELRNPRLAVDVVADACRHHWGVRGTFTEIPSNQDQNVRVDAADGRRYVLKVANERTPTAELHLQDLAMRHLRSAGVPFDIPEPLPTTQGEDVVEVEGHGLRLLTWVEGTPMAAPGGLPDERLAAFGRLAARTVAALADADLPGADRLTQWDPRQAHHVVDALAPRIGDLLPAGFAEEALARADAGLVGLAEHLPMQVIHGDLTDFNVVGRRDGAGRLQPVGLIDFGDVVRTWRVAELAVTATGLVARSPGDALRAVVEVTRGFHAAVALAEVEADALWAVVLARAALLAVSDSHQVVVEPGNEYARHTQAIDRGILEAVVAVPPRLGRAAIRGACGLPPDPAAAAVARRLARVTGAAPDVGPALDPAAIAGYDVVDLSVASDDLDAGAWADPDALATLLHRPGRVVVGRHGEARLTATPLDEAGEPATVHLGHDLFVPPGTVVVAPLGGTVVATGERSVVVAPRHPDLADVTVRLANVDSPLAPGAGVEPGDLIGRVAGPGPDGLPAHVHIQAAVGLDAPPVRVPARHRDAWLALSPPLWSDPAWCAPAPEPPEVVLERRRAVVARAQKVYYPRQPVEIVRGWRHHLHDVGGRAYLDLVNNVAVVGHSHPAITEAAARQLRRLNTNSRFLYPPITELAERLVALVPDPLASVFFVSSGSEAVDLALRLARHVTGRRGVVAIEGGYHGWTTSVTEFVSNRYDNPPWEHTRPPWVEIVPSPDGYRGPHRDAADPGRSAAEDVQTACWRLHDQGGVAAFVFEGLLGNQGGLDLPDGYLAAACAAVHDAGGVCIADEVQVGYGRTGDTWWAFERHDVVPDIVTVAKAMGNGHPVGAVITTTDIAESFAAEYPFFSSVGGGPVSCAIAVAVLDVIEAEALQANARGVGGLLKAGLAGLGERHELVGAVHGQGLYLGVDLVRDRHTREPAVAEAEAVCERLRDLGVIAQPTGDLGNIVKVKPPLCITADSARFAVEAFDRVLTDGW